MLSAPIHKAVPFGPLASAYQRNASHQSSIPTIRAKHNPAILDCGAVSAPDGDGQIPGWTLSPVPGSVRRDGPMRTITG